MSLTQRKMQERRTVYKDTHFQGITYSSTGKDRKGCAESASVSEKKQAAKSIETVNGLNVMTPEVIEETGFCTGGKYQYIDTLVKALPLLKHFANYNVKPVALDLETGCWKKGDEPDAFSSPIYLMSCSTKRGEAYVFDMRALMYEDGNRFRATMQHFLQQNKFVCHNGAFEQAFLLAQYGVLIDVEFDTMLGSQILTAGLQLGNGLDDCYKRYLGLTLDKEERKFFTSIHPSSPLTNAAIAYSAGDVTQLKELASAQYKELVAKGLLHIWEDIEKPFLPILTKAKLAGVSIDVEKLTEIRKELEETVAEHLRVFECLVGTKTYTRGKRNPVEVTEPAVNIASWKQLLAWYRERDVEIEGTGEEVLSALVARRSINKRVKEFTQCVLDYRKDSKVLSTYVIPLLEKSRRSQTGRIHPDWKQMVDTGRMACRNPNLQNVPSKGEWARIRECFVSRPGHKLIVADYSQMELRILAQLSQEPKMIEAFRSGEDLHSKTAEALFGAGWTKEQRAIAKTFNFAVCYGSGPGTLADQADIPIWQAKQLLSKYFKTYPKLKEYLDSSQRHAKDECFCETPAGRKRFFNRPDPSAENYKAQMAAIGREGGNMPIQGCNADATKIASRLFEERKNAANTQIILWVHDEIVVQADEGIVDREVATLEWCMIQAAEIYVTDLPVEVSITVGERWEK